MSEALSSDLQKVISACHHDPFSILGKHQDENGIVVRTHMPHAVEVMIAEGENVMQRVHDTAVFEWKGAPDALPEHYRILWRDDQHREPFRCEIDKGEAADRPGDKTSDLGRGKGDGQDRTLHTDNVYT